MYGNWGGGGSRGFSKLCAYCMIIPNSTKKTQKKCGGLGGENEGSFPKTGPTFKQPFSLPESADSVLCCWKIGEEVSSSIEISRKIGTSDFQSEVGEVFGEIGGELLAKFGRRFSSFFCWENRQKHFPPKLHRKFHHQTSLRGSGLWPAGNFRQPQPFRAFDKKLHLALREAGPKKAQLSNVRHLNPPNVVRRS